MEARQGRSLFVSVLMAATSHITLRNSKLKNMKQIFCTDLHFSVFNEKLNQLVYIRPDLPFPAHRFPFRNFNKGGTQQMTVSFAALVPPHP